MSTAIIYSHRRALALWLIASGVIWVAAIWVLADIG
jgi:hypothetical protein